MLVYNRLLWNKRNGAHIFKKLLRIEITNIDFDFSDILDEKRSFDEALESSEVIAVRSNVEAAVVDEK
jgi:hypothetical protein